MAFPDNSPRKLFHDTPTFATRNINPNSTNSLPAPYATAILAADLIDFPSGGIKNSNTLDELRRALNQVAKDNKAYLDGLQVQVTNNDGDITIIDTNLTEIQADLENVARDLSRKAWESILIQAGTGLSGGGTIREDRTLNLKISSPSEIGGVLSSNETIAETIGTSAENAINGHIEVTGANGYMKVKDNAVELGVKTRGDYIKNITSTTADGITLTNGTGEGAITDLKLTDIHSGQAAILGGQRDTGTNSVVGDPMPAGKIRRVDVPNIFRDKYGRITGDSPVTVNSANNYDITVSVGDGLAVTGAQATDANTGVVKQNKGANQSFTINHSPSVGTLADTTFNNTPVTNISNYQNYNGQGDYELSHGLNFPYTLSGITFDNFGHTKLVSKRALTYGLDSPDLNTGQSVRPYPGGLGSTFDLNVPTEQDFNNLRARVTLLQGNRVLIPTTGNIQLTKSSDVTGSLAVSQNLAVDTDTLYVDSTSDEVGINTSNPSVALDVVGDGKFSGDLTVGDDIFLGSAIHHTSDTNTKIEFPANDTIDLATAGSSRIRITSDGKVGIGKITPLEKLHVAGNLVVGRDANATNDTPHAIIFGGTHHDALDSSQAHTAIATRLYGASDSEKSELLLFKGNDAGTSAGPDRIRHRAGEHVFQTYTSAEKFFNGAENTNRYAVNDDNTRMVITNGGRVGIGTTSPTAKLHVQAPFTGDPNIPGRQANTADNSPSARFDSTVICEGNLVVKGLFNLTNGIAFDNWQIADNTGNVTAGGLQDFTNSLDSTAKDIGAVTIEGGLGVGKNITTGSLRATSGGNGSTYGGLQVDVAQTGTSKPANTAIINLKGFGGRGAGILIKDTVNNTPNDSQAASDREWFVGSGYGQSVFNIGYSATGSQTSYSDQTKFSIGTTGNVNAVGNITAQGNLIGVNGTLSGDADITGNTDIGGILTVDGGTTLGNSTSAVTIVSGDFVAGGTNTRNKLFWDTSTSRLGIGETTPTAHFDTEGGSKVDIVSNDNQVSEVLVRGDGQGAGRVYVGQSNTNGGGIQYEGNKSNVNLGIGTEDHVQFFRRFSTSGGTDQLVFEYSTASNGAVKYNMPIQMISGTAANKDITGVNELSATTLTGTLSTAAQTNVTSLGTLTGLTVSGNTTFSGTSATVDFDGNITQSVSKSAVFGDIKSGGDLNAVPTAEYATFNKFGLIGNRSSVYVTNANSGGKIQFGIGGDHGDNNMMILESDGNLTIGDPVGTVDDARLNVGGAIKLSGKFGSFGTEKQSAAPNNSRAIRKEYIQFASVGARSDTEIGSDSARIYSEHKGINDGSTSTGNTDTGTLVLEMTDNGSNDDSFIIRTGTKNSDNILIHRNRARFGHSYIGLLGKDNLSDGAFGEITPNFDLGGEYAQLFGLDGTHIGQHHSSLNTSKIYEHTTANQGGFSFMHKNQIGNRGILGIANDASCLILNNTRRNAIDDDTMGDSNAIQFRRQGVGIARINVNDGIYDRIGFRSGKGSSRTRLGLNRHYQPVARDNFLVAPSSDGRASYPETEKVEDGALCIHHAANSEDPHIKFAHRSGTKAGHIYTNSAGMFINSTQGYLVRLQTKDGIAADFQHQNSLSFANVTRGQACKVNGSVGFTRGFTISPETKKPIVEAGFNNLVMQQIFTPNEHPYTNALARRFPIKAEIGYGLSTSVVTQGAEGNYYEGRNANGQYVGEVDITYQTLDATDLASKKLRGVFLPGRTSSAGGYRYYDTGAHGTMGHTSVTQPDSTSAQVVPDNRVVDIRTTHEINKRADFEAIFVRGTVENVPTRYRIELGRGTTVETAQFYPVYDGISRANSSDPTEMVQGWPNDHFIKFKPNRESFRTDATTFEDGHKEPEWSSSVYATDEVNGSGSVSVQKLWRYVRITRRTDFSSQDLATVSGNNGDESARQLTLNQVSLMASYRSSGESKTENGLIHHYQSSDDNNLKIALTKGTAFTTQSFTNIENGFTELNKLSSDGQGSIYVQNQVVTGGVIKSLHPDFEINSSPRRTLTASGGDAINNDTENDRRRALVHGYNDKLIVNYGNDYTGGTEVNGVTNIAFKDGTEMTGIHQPKTRYIHSVHTWFRAKWELVFRNAQNTNARYDLHQFSGIATFLHDGANNNAGVYQTFTCARGDANRIPSGVSTETNYTFLTDYDKGYGSGTDTATVATSGNTPARSSSRTGGDKYQKSHYYGSDNDDIPGLAARLGWYPRHEVYGEQFGRLNDIDSRDTKVGARAISMNSGNSGRGGNFGEIYCVRMEVRDTRDSSYKQVHWWGAQDKGFTANFANRVDEQSTFGGLSSYTGGRLWAPIITINFHSVDFVLDLDHPADQHGGIPITIGPGDQKPEDTLDGDRDGRSKTAVAGIGWPIQSSFTDITDLTITDNTEGHDIDFNNWNSKKNGGTAV